MELGTRRQELLDHELNEPEMSAGQQGTQNLTENLTAPPPVAELARIIHMCAESLTEEDAEAVGAAGSVSRKWSTSRQCKISLKMHYLTSQKRAIPVKVYGENWWHLPCTKRLDATNCRSLFQVQVVRSCRRTGRSTWLPAQT